MRFLLLLICLFSLTKPIDANNRKLHKSAKTNQEAAPSNETQLIKTLTSLTDAPMTKIGSTKIVESALIGKKTNYVGEILLSHGKFRWNTFSPEKSTLLFDGKTLWVIQDQFVTKQKLSKNMKSQTLKTILFDPKTLKKKFTLTERKEAPEVIAFSLKSKAKDVAVNNIVVTLDSNTKELKKLSYDENDSKTVIEFNSIEKLQKADSSQFTYKPKAGDQVTEM